MVEFSFGQFYPANSVIHRLDARVKLIGVIALIVALLFRRQAILFLLFLPEYVLL